MCFYNDDYDWVAEVHESGAADGGPKSKCMECRCVIDEEVWRHNVYLQQYEECQEYEDDDTHCCENHESVCRFGETFDGVWCRECRTVLDAIGKVEESEGCPKHSQQPPLEMMREYIEEGEGWSHYADKMRTIGLEDAAAIVERKFLKLEIA